MKTNYFTSRNTMKTMFITAIIFLAITHVKAQTIYKTSPGPTESIKVLGTSNVHDWTMTSTGVTSRGSFKFEGEHLAALRDFSLSVDVKTLKSDHSSMDNRTYKTINADQYPKIIYKLNSAIVTLVSKNKYLIKTTGDLTIAGATQIITMDVTALVDIDNSITCTGTEKIKLTDYKITPPTFMLGAMKVYNDLDIQFNLVYKN